MRRRPLGSRSAHGRGRPVEWVGGRVTLPVYVTEGEPYRPQAVMWLELPSELVLGFSMIDPAKSPPSFSDTLRGVLISPLAGPPRRPTRVRVADQALAAEARAALGDPGGADVVVAPTPELDELVHQFARSLPDGDEPESYLEDGRVSAAAVERLFRAAEVLYHVAPWKFANDGQLLRLDVAERRIAGAALSVIGALGESLGFLVFPSPAAYDTFAETGERLMRQRLASAKIDLGSSYVSVTFERAADIPREMRGEVLEHAWPVAGPDVYPRVEVRERDGIARPLTEEDVRLATAVAGALTAFAIKHEALLRGSSVEPVSESYTGETGLTVRLTAPYEAFDLFGEEVEDAPRGERAGRRVGRNEPCPCGSGKKYKRCHLGTEADLRASSGATAPAQTAALHELDRRLADAMAAYARQRYGAEWLRFERDFTDARAAEQLSLHWALYHLRVRGGRVVDHFRAERGDRLTGEEREWLDAQSRSWLGVWEVEDQESGASLDLHDILTGERRHVTEASGSRMLVRRSTVLARVVDHGGVSLICGMHPQPLPPIDAVAVARLFRDRLRRGATAPAERLREERLGRDLIARWEEAAAALEERSRIPPRVQNRDGDELVFISERYDFDPAAQEEIQRRLAAMDAVVPPEAGDEDRDYIFHREGPATRPGLEDIVVGHVVVDGRSISLETNSVRRANALRSRVETALGNLIRQRRRRRRDAQRMVARMWEREPSRHGAAAASGAHSRDELADTPEAQQALREMKERHYADWPDQSLPALGDQTPRRAIRTKIGRERVDALLKDIEFREAGLRAGERFDVAVLRRTLGL